jgi:hypothetical protein
MRVVALLVPLAFVTASSNIADSILTAAALAEPPSAA